MTLDPCVLTEASAEGYHPSVPFPKDQLHSSEEIVLDLRPHWWFFASQASTLAAALVLGIFALIVVDNAVVNVLAAVLLLAVLAWFLIRYLVWSTTSFVITTDRVITRAGVLGRSGHRDPARAHQHGVLQPVPVRADDRGSGDLEIESASEQGTQKIADIRQAR